MSRPRPNAPAIQAFPLRLSQAADRIEPAGYELVAFVPTCGTLVGKSEADIVSTRAMPFKFRSERMTPFVDEKPSEHYERDNCRSCHSDIDDHDYSSFIRFDCSRSRSSISIRHSAHLAAKKIPTIRSPKAHPTIRPKSRISQFIPSSPLSTQATAIPQQPTGTTSYDGIGNSHDNALAFSCDILPGAGDSR